MTIEQLTRIPYLQTWIHAGASGAENVIEWAHSIELPRPWEWLERGDLLMTVGLGIPSDPAAQVDYIRKLAGIGVSGVTIGHEMQAPPLSDEMIEAAEQLAFPICFTAYAVPFVQISRTIAAAGREDYARILGVTRIYEQARMAAARNATTAGLLNELESELQCDLFAFANEDGGLLASGSPDPSPATVADISEAVRASGEQQPGLRRVQVGGREACIIPIPAQRSVSLVAVSRGSQLPAFAMLQHVATLTALELQRLWAQREQARRRGSELLAHILDNRIARSVAVARLDTHGLADGPYRLLVALLREEELHWAEHLHHRLAERDVAHLLLRRDNILHALICDADTIFDTVASLFPLNAIIGVSAPFRDLDSVQGAAREARWALDSAKADGRRIVRYGDRSALFYPRSVTEAQEMVDSVLGAVLAWDTRHDSNLIESLQVFLDCNRAWQRASTELHVHKQTLVYRMHRIEQLTSRKLNNTADVSQLWLALQALKMIA
ncbi:PucR family transcriptional regulator [Conexibacter sp. S30A1]|uniref:PucR family transcriptional regulator n=1 Tax=Conexibacter sp. S30A1 TaxID=2937800 RepID=UPI0020102A81|nr:PucR family transcriptional regulator [Conexibacter sp. S30A1]